MSSFGSAYLEIRLTRNCKRKRFVIFIVITIMFIPLKTVKLRFVITIINGLRWTISLRCLTDSTKFVYRVRLYPVGRSVNCCNLTDRRSCLGCCKTAFSFMFSLDNNHALVFALLSCGLVAVGANCGGSLVSTSVTGCNS